MSEKIINILSEYNYFEDGLLLSFEFFYPAHERVTVKIVFHARNPVIDGNVWEKICITAKDVEEIVKSER